MLKPLNSVRNLKDPIKMFCCNFNIAFPAESPLNAYIDSEQLELRVQTFGLPTITGDKTTVQWGGFERRYGGKQTRAGDWTVSCTEVWDAKITDTFRAWCNAYHNYKNGTIALLDAYTATVNVTLVDPDVYEPQPEGITRYDMRLFDVFPTSVSYPAIQASSSEPVELNITLSYNYFLLGSEIDGQ